MVDRCGPSKKITQASTNDTREALLRRALDAQAAYLPEVRADIGSQSAEWISAQTFFSDQIAIDEFILFEQSRYDGVDLKTAGALMMNDYSYIIAAATVPLFTGFGLIADLSLASVGLRFYTTKKLVDGKIYRARRAHVHFAENLFGYGQLDNPSDGEWLRSQLEKHFSPVVEQIHARTSLSRAALWRLAGDAIAYLFLDSGRRFDTAETAKAAAMRILKVHGSPFANRELRYFDLAVADRHHHEKCETFVQRGGCCRFYHVDGGAYCSTCVLKAPADRDDELRQAIRNRLETN